MRKCTSTNERFGVMVVYARRNGSAEFGSFVPAQTAVNRHLPTDKKINVKI
jgi:hypothetical protein